MAPLIFTRDLSVRIAGHDVCRLLNWQVNPGERWAILGRNGVGKSTLLATLAGLRPAASGQITVCGVNIGVSPTPTFAPTFHREMQRTLAQRRGYLTQHHSDPFPSTVLETALIGRHPHLGRWDWESANDHAIAHAALAKVDLAAFVDREVQTLSGGERQRLAVAQLLVQQPQLFLLDEPLTHLDLAHQVAVMELFRQQTQSDAAMVAVLHDPGFAVRYCEHALLLFGEGEWLAGPSQDIITAEHLGRLYGYPLREICSGHDRWFIPCQYRKPMTDPTQHATRMQRKKQIIDEKIAEASDARGLLLVNTGIGKGKSSAAFGVLARALGHGFKAGVVQFVKSRTDTGEEGFFRRQPNVAWHVMGEGFTWETQDKEKDARAAQAAWHQSRLFLADPTIQLVILDELTYAFKYGWLELDDVLADLAARPPMQHVIITGRAAPEKLIAAADTVTDMSLVKHAFKSGVQAMPGVEF